MKYRKVTDADRRRIQLDMLKEIDGFCRMHQIRCSLSNGTLLGAIRHGGYIPWDDDVDIVMPLPDMLRFKENFVSETLKYCDIDTERHYEFPFPRIVYQPTFSRKGPFLKSYGVSIDLYPVLGLPKSKDEVNRFFEELKEMRKARKRMLKWFRRAQRYLSLSTIPGFDASVRRFKDRVFSFPYEDSHYLFHYGGDIKWSKVFEEDLFEDMTELSFEGEKFRTFSKYDYYLSHVYGNYMQLPPENQRHPYHLGDYYWK